MPSKSKSQQRLMAAAAHGATFEKAKELRKSMTQRSLEEFARTKTKHLPEKTSNRYPRR